MPTGSVTLLEASKASSNPIKKGVVDTIIQESPILEQLPIITFAGNALQSSTEQTLPDVSFRQVNASYTRTWGADNTYLWGVAILGGEVFVDNFIVRTRGDIVDIKARQFQKMGKSMARTFDKTFFDGLGTSNDFKGVNALIDEGFGTDFDDGQTNGNPITLNRLDEMLDLLRVGDADALLINRFHRRKITQLGRDASNHPLIDIGSDRFGRKVTQYDGVPMRIIGDDRSGTAILGFDETQSGSSVCSSMYAIRYGEEENVTGLLGAGGMFEVVDFGEIQEEPGHLGRVEAYPGIAIFDKYSVVRYHGITEA